MPGELTNIALLPDDETGEHLLMPGRIDSPAASQPDVENAVDESTLAHLWQKGRKAWSGVSSASEWVESLRGHELSDGPGIEREDCV